MPVDSSGKTAPDQGMRVCTHREFTQWSRQNDVHPNYIPIDWFRRNDSHPCEDLMRETRNR
jgi:hypothetical protein